MTRTEAIEEVVRASVAHVMGPDSESCVLVAQRISIEPEILDNEEALRNLLKASVTTEHIEELVRILRTIQPL